jgi:hypothetical protein
MGKICSKCGKEKDMCFYHKDKISKDGYRNDCKECRKECGRKRRLDNLDIFRKKEREKYKKANKEKERLRNTKRYASLSKEKKERMLQQRKERYLKNRKYELELNKKWRKNNKDKCKEINKRSDERRRKTIQFVISNNISRAIRMSILDKKKRKWENIVGYSIEDLINRLTNTVPIGFTLEDYRKGKLHVDHIIPKSLFIFSSCEDTEFKKCWNLRNLRFVEGVKNISKFNKFDMNLVEEYNIKDLLPEKI